MNIHVKQITNNRWVTFGAHLAKYPKTMRFLGLASVLLSASYLVGRLLFTWSGADPVLFWALWSAEFIGWLTLALFVRDSWGRRVELAKGQVDGTVAILIPTYNEGPEVLEPTILGALGVQNCNEIWILDDGNREWVKNLAESKIVNYLARTEHDHAKAGNINNALRYVDTDFILILDADHIPAAEIVDNLKAYFVTDEVAVVQSPHGFRNLDSTQHYDRRVHDQSLFFEVLLPGRNATKSVFWCGSGALIRKAHLQAVGGVQTQTITEDLETSIALQRAGFRTVYHNEILLQGLAPANLSSYLIQRYRWARGTLEVLTRKGSPIFGKGFSITTRLSYLSNLIYYFVPLQHIAFVMVLAATLITGKLPIAMSSIWLLILWLPQLLLSLFVGLGLSEGRQLPFSGSRNAWLTADIYIRAFVDRILNKKSTFQVTPKDGVEEGGMANLRMMWLPALAGVLLLVGLAVRFLSLVFDQQTDQPLNGLGGLLAIFFAIYELAVIAPVVWRAIVRQQHRREWRFSVDLVGNVNASQVRVTDLHLGGVQFVASMGLAQKYNVGQAIELQIKAKDGSVANGIGIVRRVFASELVSIVGASVDWSDSASRDVVVKAAYIKHHKTELT